MAKKYVVKTIKSNIPSLKNVTGFMDFPTPYIEGDDDGFLSTLKINFENALKSSGVSGSKLDALLSDVRKIDAGKFKELFGMGWFSKEPLNN
jgi:hypothetical protein